MRRAVLILNKADILATLACLLISAGALALYPHSTGLAEEVAGPPLPKEDTGFKDKLKRWREMSPEQKEIIKERFRQWKDLPPEERGKLRQNFQRFKAMPPEERQILKERFRRFKNLSPEERQGLLENYEKWRSLDPEKRKELREGFKRWKDMPLERRREMKGRLRKPFPPGTPDGSASPPSQTDAPLKPRPNRPTGPPPGGKGKGRMDSPPAPNPEHR
ncbi:MAG TPA: DUF3106 domain-containing protein [Candidatus Tripitaka sp. YC43]